MIVQEQFGDTNLIHTYSDEGFKIRQVETGTVYDEAIDIPNKYTYEETDIPIEEQPEEENNDEVNENENNEEY